MMMIVIIGWGLMASHDPSVSFLESRPVTERPLHASASLPSITGHDS